MAIRIECPRCRQLLSVPSKMAGSYANCVRCKGRFWVPRDAAADSSVAEGISAVAPSAAAALPTAAPPMAAPPVTAPPVTAPPLTAPPISMPQTAAAPPRSGPMPLRSAPAPAPPVVRPAASPRPIDSPVPVPRPPTPSVPVPPGPAPLPGVVPSGGRPRKIARMITAEAAQSTLKPAADGQLPDLQLQEGPKRQRADSSGSSVNPLVMFGLLSLSIVMSIVLVMVDWDTPTNANQATKDIARKYIEEHFFGGGNLERGDLRPYQRYLREAQAAHERRDAAGERDQYRKVLNFLRAERSDDMQGVTGSRSNDRDLEDHIRKILSGS